MKTENFDIDGLVQSILADLTVKAEPVRTETKVAVPSDVKTGEVFIDGRVVSLADIKSRLGEAKKLVILPKSILTPSAKDEIRKRKIEVAVRLPQSTVERRSALWLATQRPAVFPAMVANAFDSKVEDFNDIATIVEFAVKRLSDKIRGVALSRQAATLLCEANRRKEIRAVFGFEPKQVAADALEIDANLLVLHPERIGNRALEIIRHYADR